MSPICLHMSDPHLSPLTPLNGHMIKGYATLLKPIIFWDTLIWPTQSVFLYVLSIPTIMLQIFPITPKQDVMKVARPQIQKLTKERAQNKRAENVISTFSFLYSSGKKSVVFCFGLLLPQILVDFQNQGQIWNLLVLMFSKHLLHVQFVQVLPEILEAKDTWYHCFIFMRFDLLEIKWTEI